MTAFLYHRLSLTGLVTRETLVRALGRSLVRRTSLTEALLTLDLAHARAISDAVAGLGPATDDAWRPDRRLIRDLPPGICEHYLTFPFRERAGRVELATVCGLDEAICREFAQHLGRPVALYRARLQGLLAAANVPIDLNALSRFLSQPPPPPSSEGVTLPLTRKPSRKSGRGPRVPTSPGMGRQASVQPSGPPPMNRASGGAGPAWAAYRGQATGLALERLQTSRDIFELAAVLGEALPAPALIFELTQDRLYLQVTLGPGDYRDEAVSLHEESAFAQAVRDGVYFGPFFENKVHSRFYPTFPLGSKVMLRRIGPPSHGLVVGCASRIEPDRVRKWLDMAQAVADHF